MGILRNPRYEMYAQGIISGLTSKEAYQKAGYRGKSKLAPRMIDQQPLVRQRIDELLKNFAARAELSRSKILERILEDWETSRRLGQMSSALKAAELYGRDLHKMFVDRKEIGGPGDFDGKSEEELREIIRNDMKDLGWDDPAIPPDKSLN